jgi:hypothetical protein
MRIPVLLILAVAAVPLASPAQAQTYDPNYPVCLQVYAPDGGYIDCSYTSLPQCNASASGRGAQCLVNPYFAQYHARRGGPPTLKRSRQEIR